MREIIVDNFAGGGGASTGIEMAIGRSVDIAINHDPNAIAMHTTNHPDTLHYCESVFDIDPVAATGGRDVGLAWFSPDCRHFSKAKGSKPVKKEIRGLAWIVVRWALTKKPRVIMLENVEEFKTWGPLIDDGEGNQKPDPDRSGETFSAFVAMLSFGIAANHPAMTEVCEFLSIDANSTDAARLVDGLGYDIDFRELRACDYGAPTKRKRFFMVMRCDGKKITWPVATHGEPNTLPVQRGELRPWRTAAECIDWSIPCPSIFDRKKPLAENTMKRIARGIERFVINNPNPFIVKSELLPFIARIGQTGFGGDRLAYDVYTPLTTITTKAEHLLIAPIIARQFGKSVGHRVDEPSGTITAGGGGKSQLVKAFLMGVGGPSYQAKPKSIEKPFNTVISANHTALVSSHLIKLRGTCKDGQPVTEPMPTITAGGLHVGEVRAFLLKYYGNEKDGVELSEPLHTVTTNDRFGLVTIEGVDYQIIDIGMRMLQPHELYAAQGFPSWYIIDRDYTGNKYTKGKQVARCGNAVPPSFAEALVRANLPELCTTTEKVEVAA